MRSDMRFEKEVHRNKHLYEFLIKNDAYNSFINNGVDHIRKHKLKDEVVIRRMRTSGNPITTAFEWDKTPEGRDYWYNLYLDYFKY